MLSFTPHFKFPIDVSYDTRLPRVIDRATAQSLSFKAPVLVMVIELASKLNCTNVTFRYIEMFKGLYQRLPVFEFVLRRCPLLAAQFSD